MEQQPNHKKDSDVAGKGIKAKSRKRLRLALVVIACFLLLPVLAGVVLRLVYNDSYIKEKIVASLSEKMQSRCEITSLDISVWSGSCTLKGFRLIAPEDKGGEFLRCDEVMLNIEYLNSLLGRRLSAKVYLDSFNLNIIRLRVTEDGAVEKDESRYTTNIHGTIADVVRMPWKKWLGSVNWMIAQGDVKFERGRVTLEDKAGILGGCAFEDIRFSLVRGAREAKVGFDFSAVSPNTKNGRFAFSASANVDQTEMDPEKLLSFITDLKVDSFWQELDVPYILRYYGLGGKGKIGWVPGSPVDGKISVKAQEMSATDILVEMNTPNTVQFFENGNPVAGATPFSLKVAGQADFSQEWSEFKPLEINMNLSDSLKMNLNTQGSLAQTITFNLDSKMNADMFAKSPLGQILRIGKSISGNVKFNSFLRWNKGEPWKFKVESSSDNLVFNSEGRAIPAGLKLGALGSIFVGAGGDFERTQMNLEFKSDGVTIESRKPFEINLAQKGKSSGELFCNIDLKKVSSNLASLWKAWGLAPVNEVLVGIVGWDDKDNLTWSFSLNNNDSGNQSFKGQPLVLRGSTNYFAGDKFSFVTAANLPGNTLLVNINGNGEKTAKGTDIDFTQDMFADMKVVPVLAERFSAFVGDWYKKLKNPAGSFRQAARGRLTVGAGDIQAALSSSMALENAAVVVDGFPWDEKKATLVTQMRLAKNNADTLFKIDAMKLRTSTANVNASTGMIRISDLSRPVEQMLASLPEFEFSANVGSLAFLHLSKFVGNSMPRVLKDGKSLVVAVKSQGGGGVITVNNFKFDSRHAAVQTTAFNFDPERLRRGLETKKHDLLLKSFSPFSVSVLCGPGFWEDLKLPKGLRFNGLMKLAASYDPKADMLDLKVFSFEGNQRNAAVIEEISASAKITNLSQLADKPDINSLVRALPQGINIPQARFSIPALKELVSADGSASFRALQGKELVLSKIVFKPKSEASFTLSGNITGNMSYYSKDAKWPLLHMDGTISLPPQKPLDLTVSPQFISVKGAVDFTGAALKFSALNPYVYRKAKGIASQIEFDLSRSSDEKVSVRYARLHGGPLDVALDGFMLIPLADKEFILKLAACKVGSPFNVSVSDLLLSKPDDTVSVKISTSGIDFARLEESLLLAYPVHLRGGIKSSEVVLTDSYRRYFGGVGAAADGVSGRGHIKIGGIDLNVSSARPGSNASFGISLAGGQAELGKGSITLDGLVVRKPAGFNYDDPVSVKTISIEPDMSTLFSDRLVINNLALDGLTATLELAFGNTNISALQKSLDELFPKAGGGTPAAETESRKTLIKVFELKGGVVKLSQTLLMGKASIPVPLPPLRLTDVGGSTAGATFSSMFGYLFDIIGKTGVGMIKNIGGAVGDIGKDVGKTIGNTLGKTLLRPFNNGK